MTDIFVFGSNLAGIHGKGAALTALRKHGAIRGQAIGLQGNSYAIPTKDVQLRTLPLDQIQIYIHYFLEHARANKGNLYQLTAIGTGLAGYRVKQIRALFRNKQIPKNVVYIGDEDKNILNQL